MVREGRGDARRTRAVRRGRANSVRRRVDSSRTARKKCRRKANNAAVRRRPTEDEQTPSGLRTDGEHEKGAQLFRKKLCV